MRGMGEKAGSRARMTSVVCELLVQATLVVAIFVCIQGRDVLLTCVLALILSIHVSQIVLCYRFRGRRQHALIAIAEACIAAYALSRQNVLVGSMMLLGVTIHIAEFFCDTIPFGDRVCLAGRERARDGARQIANTKLPLRLAW